MAEYKPKESDLIWCKNLIRVVNEGAVWGTSWGIYKFNKKEKKIVLQEKVPHKDWNFEDNHKRMKIVFKKIGWEVI